MSDYRFTTLGTAEMAQAKATYPSFVRAYAAGLISGQQLDRLAREGVIPGDPEQAWANS